MMGSFEYVSAADARSTALWHRRVGKYGTSAHDPHTLHRYSMTGTCGSHVLRWTWEAESGVSSGTLRMLILSVLLQCAEVHMCCIGKAVHCQGSAILMATYGMLKPWRKTAWYMALTGCKIPRIGGHLHHVRSMIDLSVFGVRQPPRTETWRNFPGLFSANMLAAGA